MRLRFDPGDDDDYDAVREALLGELRAWLDRPEQERAAVVTDVEILLDWRYHDSNGVLDELAPGDVTEFLLQWCPAQFKGHPNGAEYLCNAVAIYVDFMAATGRLVGGIERANRLRELAVELAPTVRAELGDPTPAVDPFSSDDDERLQAALAEIEERYGPGPIEEPEPYELPFVYIRTLVTGKSSSASRAIDTESNLGQYL